jgi:hypothetical protein
MPPKTKGNSAALARQEVGRVSLPNDGPIVLIQAPTAAILAIPPPAAAILPVQQSATIDHGDDVEEEHDEEDFGEFDDEEEEDEGKEPEDGIWDDKVNIRMKKGNDDKLLMHCRYLLFV